MANNEDKLLDYLKRVTSELRQAQRRLKEGESAAHEPVAIVGMACRFPGGVRSAEDLWRLVAEGQDAISGLPTDRNWDLEQARVPDPVDPDTSYVPEGGFLDDATGFDAAFFGISPREALGMAPQQRLALEVAWEAIEHARIAPSALKNSLTGTFIGCDHLDYVSDPSQVPEGSAGYFTIGNTASVVSGRVAYTLGLEGAALTVDTACSSSLVALHLACQAIRQGECDMALAGGVAVMSSLAPLVGFGDLRTLAPDGRSKAFSANADGMTMSEGVGVILLERLSDAQRNGHRVLAVVRGSAMNQDGTTNGLTAPNGPSQQRVIRQALANARLSAADVDAVEAHGTGTPLGDPIEGQALLATYGQDHSADRPLWLGSIKSNIGHAQMAAGVAGVIKMVMAMRQGTLPTSLHIDEPTPHVDWSSGVVRLLTEPVEWRREESPRRAGVSSFGISGTNAHVILEEAPEPGEVVAEATPAPVGGVLPWVLSARSGEALRGQAAALALRAASDPDLPAADVGWSLVATRSAFEHRAVVIGEDSAELLAGVRALASGETHPGVVRSGGRAAEGRTVWLFTGQGSQRPGMGAELYARFPVFAEAFDEVCGLLDPHLDHPLKPVVFGGAEQRDLLDHTTYAQAGLFALQVALARLLTSLGQRPDTLIGHSIGEISAAHVAGVFDLADACRLVAARATLMGRLPAGGAMTAIEATAEELAADVEASAGVAVAALNTPTSTVVSGPDDLVAELTAAWAAKGRKTKRLTVSHAFHSAQMDPILEEFGQSIGDLTYHAPAVPVIGNLTGLPAGEEMATADYWVRQVRQPVRFHPAVAHVAAETAVFLELGPDPVLASATQHVLHDLATAETAETDPPERLVTALLNRKRDEVSAFAAGLAHLYAAGAGVDWPAWYAAGRGLRAVDLPTYAFQHERFWLEPPTGTAARTSDEAETALWEAIDQDDLDRLTATVQAEGADGREKLAEALPILSAWRRRRRERGRLDANRYRVDWTPIGQGTTPTLSGTYLVLTPDGEHPALAPIEQALTTHGAEAHVQTVDPAAGRAAFAELLAELTAAYEPVAIVSLLALDTAPHPDHPAVPVGLAATIALLQAHTDGTAPYPLWCVTQGAVATSDTDPLPHPQQATVWGAGRVAALEHPHHWGGLIDLPDAVSPQVTTTLAGVLAPGQPEDQVAIRPNAAYARRLAQAPAPAAPATPWTPTGTTLVTGGTGGIGATVARWLAANGAPHLLLLSRQGPDHPDARRLAEELGQAGATVTVTACDVTDRARLGDAIDAIPAEHPLTAVFHTAGVLDVGPVADLDPARLAGSLDAKALGAAHLHELTQDLGLTAFVLFSSNAATWGSGQQSAYAAANGYLDALAEHRRANGLAATSIQWGPWSEVGMAADEGTLSYLARRGVKALAPDQAIAALHDALTHDETTLCFAELDWQRFAAAFTAQRPSPLLTDLAPAIETAAPAAGGDTELRQQLAGATPAQQQHLLLRHIQAGAAGVLGHSGPDAVDPGQPFHEQGFDSLTAVELRNLLATTTGLTLPPALIFDHPTPVALAKHLLAQISGRHATPATTARASTSTNEPIAIIGMACHYPGNTHSPEQLFNLTATATDAITGMPTDRNWPLSTLYNPDPDHSGTTYTTQGGFLHTAPQFDNHFFGISPREALAMDPQQRLLLETAWETIENAGLTKNATHGTNTGVYFGGTYEGYGSSASSADEEVEGYLLAGGTPSVMSGRVAYALGLEGPAVTVDTACSSSLVAIHLASQALRQGECDLALAGGVAVMATPTTFVEFSRQRGLAPDGRCKPFAAAADGTGWSEGVGLVALERLSDAERNGHHILAVIRGSAVNQDGASNGLTAPNGPSQERVIHQALANARLTTADIDAVEAHGTGTTLGDPIEAHALLSTYGQNRPEDRPLWLGSLKSNIGHTQAAAGVGGVIKMVMAMRHDLLPQTLHVDEPTPHVDWSSGAVRLLTESAPWPRTDDRPRRAGVSAFGIGGTNAHLILEQPPEPATEETADEEADDGGLPWLVSARSDRALQGQAAALAAHLTEYPDATATTVGWSLLKNRTAFEHRAVITGTDRRSMTEALRALANGRPHPDVTSPGTPAITTHPGPVFVFPGQGSQWAGMATELLDSAPVFADAMDECQQALAPYIDWTLTDVLRGDGTELDRVDVVQPVLWATMVSLAKLWIHHGVTPTAVVGHSQGEIAAAYIADALSIEDAARVVALRSQALRQLAGHGAMASIGASDDRTGQLLENAPDVSVAAVNSPESTVISGPPDQVRAVVDEAQALDLHARMIDVDYASHSPQVDGIADDLGAALAGVMPTDTTVPFYSTVSAGRIDTGTLDTAYWITNLREPVRFADTVGALLDDGHRVFIEMSPHPVLTLGVQQTVDAGDTDAVAVPTLRRDHGNLAQFVRALGDAFTRGVDIDWTRFTGSGPRTIPLPTYAFQHEHYWLAPSADAGQSAGSGSGDEAESALWAAIERDDLDAVTATVHAELNGDTDGSAREKLAGALPILSAWRRRHRERNRLAAGRYRVTWAPLTRTGTPALSGTYVLLTPDRDHPARATIEQALTGHGGTVHTRTVDPATERGALAELLTELTAAHDPTAIISLLALDDTPHPDHPAVPAGLAGTVALVQAHADAAPDAPCPLWCVTQGAVAIADTDPLPHPRQATVWGAGRVAALEHPHHWGGLIDLPDVVSPQVTTALAAVFASGRPEDQIAIRATSTYVRRLNHAPNPTAPATAWTPTGTTLIAGGTGGIGATIARFLADNGAPHLLLLSRQGPGHPDAQRLTEEITRTGTKVTIAACDVTSYEQLENAIAGIPAEHPLTTVVHSAGLPENAPLAGIDLPHLSHIVEAKVLAASHLHELTKDRDLDAFVLCSSVAAVWGSGLQTSYAAANSYVDALAEHRRTLGLPAMSIQWGHWRDVGMADVDATHDYLARRGMTPLVPEQAVEFLRHALGSRETTVSFVDVDWEKFAAAFTAQRPSPLLTELAPATETAAPAARTEADTELRQQLAGASAAQRQHLLLKHIQTKAASILGHTNPSAVIPSQPFHQQGFDSLTAVELRNHLTTTTGLALPPTLIFDHPTPTALTKHLLAQISGQYAAPVTTARASTNTNEPIAIIGMACHYPGNSNTPEQLFNLTATATDAITGMPTDRNWPLATLYNPDPDHPGTTYTTQGGFLATAPQFDNHFFGISPREALAMDPQQRLLLETAWETIENAGLTKDTTHGTNTGVFTGVTSQDYMTLINQASDDLEGYIGTGNAPAVLSGRVAYTLGLEGPAVTVDTGCSSSLVAIHLASQALRQGECELALAGGVTVMATPGLFNEFARQRGLAADGRCKSFAASADGTGFSEGVGLLLLERLSDAERNGHQILAVVRGSATNQDGASNGLTAPNGPSQQRVIRAALAGAGLSTADIDAVEAHGTGTTLGDPIEAQAVIATYGQDRPEDRPLLLGSLKSNIGHTQAAAGVGGVIKMVMAMRHGLLPQTLHVEEPSSNVDWSAGSVELLTDARSWPETGQPRRAGVSAFGIGGTNAHLILEQAPRAEETSDAPESEEDQAGGVLPWPVSARSDQALRAQAAALAAHLTHHPDATPAAVGWSLLKSRTTFEHRAVVTGDDRPTMIEALRSLASGRPHPSLVAPNVPAITSHPGPVFVFPGQGSQWAGMATELLDSAPVFADAMDECQQALAPYIDWTLTDVLRGDGTELDRVDVVQPVLWATMVSLAKLWTHHGVTPAAVIGHSQGEIAAAYVAGALSLEESAKISALRSQALRQLAGTGTMASLGTTPEQAGEWLAALAPDVAIAAVNGPASIVVSGPPGQINALVAHAEAGNVRARTIDVDYASHHPDIDRITDDLTDALMGIMPTFGEIPFYSTVTADQTDTFTLDTSYWIANLRRPVRFADTVQALLDDGHRVFIEASPHPVLTFGIQQTIDAGETDAVTVPTLRRDHGGLAQFTQAAAAAHNHGTAVDWTGWYPDPTPPTIPLPTYAFQRRRFWLEPAATTGRAAPPGAGDQAESVLWEAIEQDDLDAVTATVHAELNGDTDASAREKLAGALPILSAWRRRSRERGRLEANRYRVTWTPLAPAGTPTLSGTYLLLTPDGDLPALTATAQALTAHGATVHTETVSPTIDRVALTERLTELTLAHDPVALVSLLGLDTTPYAGHPAVPVGLAATITLVQAHTDGSPDSAAPLWCLTQGAVATGTEPLPHPQQATVWGAGRTAALEHPNHWGGLIDLPADLDGPHVATALATALVPGQPEDQVAIRPTATYVRRLAHSPTPGTPAVPWTPTGTALVTGGTGGIGAAVARWLAGNGTPHLLLLSRQGPDHPDAKKLTEDLTKAGARVTITACDVGDRAQLENAIEGIPAEHPLTTVVHAAGLPENAPLPGIDVPHIERIIGAKAHGATLLHELTRDLDVTAFVLFSSGAAVWGSGSQACYSAANSYLDALAEHRRANGLPATSIQWGPWSEVGMAANEQMIEFYGRRGFTYFTPEQGIAAMRTALTYGETTLCFADADWATFAATFTARRRSPLLSELAPPAEAAPVPAAAEADNELRQQLAAATTDQRRHLLLQHVQLHAAAVLGHTDPDAVNPTQPFHQQGFDSLTAVELRNHLTGTTALALPPTLIFDHPSPTDLAEFLSRQLGDTDVADEGRIISDLDKWDLLCEPSTIDEAARQRVSRRLELLLQKWSATGDQDGSSTAHQDLEEASAEDIFDLIAEEFGKS